VLNRATCLSVFFYCWAGMGILGFGAGMGLANIRRCADMMKLLSGPGGGTRLDIEFLFGDSALAPSSASQKKP